MEEGALFGGAHHKGGPPLLHAKHDIEELQLCKQKTRDLEANLRERLRPVLGLHTSRQESLKQRMEQAALAPIEKSRLLLELEETEHSLVEIGVGEALRRESELRGLVALKAEWRSERVRQVEEMLGRLERGERLASVQQLVEEITRDMPERAAHKVDLQVEREKTEGLAEISAIFHDKREAHGEDGEDGLQTIEEEERVARARVSKACEAKRKTLLAQEVREVARARELQEVKAEELLNVMMAPSDLRDLNLLRREHVKELVRLREAHSRSFTGFHAKQEKQLRDYGVVAEREVQDELATDGEEQALREEHDQKIQEIRELKDGLIAQLAQITENPRLHAQLEEQLVEAEMQIEKERASLGERLEMLGREKQVRKVVLHEERLGGERLKIERALIEEACGLVRREEAELQKQNRAQVRFILRRLAREHARQEEDCANTVGEILKVTEALWVRLMAEELGGILARQQLEKELVVASLQGNASEEKLVGLQGEKMLLDLRKAELQERKLREKWGDARYFQEYQRTILKYENLLKARTLASGLRLARAQARALANLEQLHARELLALRESQLLSFLELVASAFQSLHQRQLAPYYHYVAVPRQGRSQTAAIRGALETYRATKDTELRARLNALRTQSAAIEENLKSKIGECYDDYAAMLERLSHEERLIKVKRETLARAVKQQKHALARASPSPHLREELVGQHEAALQELEKALLSEQKRQQGMLRRLVRKKEQQLAFEEEVEHCEYQQNARRLQVESPSSSETPSHAGQAQGLDQEQDSPLKLPLQMLEQDAEAVDEVADQLRNWSNRVKLNAASPSRQRHKKLRCGDLLLRLQVLEEELEHQILKKTSAKILPRSETFR